MGAPKGNKFALGNKGGAPPHYESAEELATAIQEYFEYCKGEEKEEDVNVYDEGLGCHVMRKVKVTVREPEKHTITGMCLFIGFESRANFYKQSERNDEFRYVVKRARMVVENRYEEMLDTKSVAGAIFALKNMDWTDKTEQEVKMDMGITWNEEKTYEAKQETDTGT